MAVTPFTYLSTGSFHWARAAVCETIPDVVEQGPQFAVLGALELHRDGEPVVLPRGRRRSALAALLVQAGRPVSRDALIAAVWGEGIPGDPQAALDTVVSRLRTVLGPELLETGPAGYRLAVDPERVDAARFDALRARAVDRPPEEAAALLDAALRLWRGPAYAEFADRDFARAEATRLDQLRLDTIEDRAAVALELGRGQDAVAAIEPVLAQEPYRERARGLLMRALDQSGRPADALESFRSYRAMLADDLGLDPSPALVEVHERILGRRGVAGPSGRSGNAADLPPAWPAGLDSFVGREADLAELLDEATAHRVVCVTGPGGVGKTRLVAESLGALGERLDIPIVVVELADVQQGQLDAAVGRALRLGPAGRPVRDAVLESLGAAPLLLVLDSCERLLADTRALVRAVGRRCTRVRVLATSRRRLGCAGERVVRLPPLPLPRAGSPPRTAQLSAAVRLFTDRLRAADPAADLGDASLAMVAEICRGLDGLPLALELAAGRAATLGLSAVRDRLGAGLDLLGDARRDPRRTLRAAVSWSYNVLGPGEQHLLQRLSAFDRPFDLEAAEQVGAATVPTPVAAAMSDLVDASLVVARRDPAGMRYRLLGIVRAFAAEQVAATGQDTAVQRARAEWAGSLARACAATALGPGSEVPFARLDLGLDDLTSAVRWCVRRGRLDLAAQIIGPLGLCPHGLPTADLYRLATHVAEHPGVLDTPKAALALGAGAEAAVQLGELDQAERLAARTRAHAVTPSEHYLALLVSGIAALYRGRYDRAGSCWSGILAIPDLPAAYRADAHACLALLHCYHGRPAAAREHAHAAQLAADRADAVAFRAFATYVTGEVLLAGDPQLAVVVLREAVAQADQAARTSAGHVGVVARIALLAALTRLGRHHEAAHVATEVLRTQLRAGTWPQLWTTARILAEAFSALGHHAHAQLLLAAADTAPSAPLLAGVDVARYQDLRKRLRDHLAPETVAGITALAGCLPRTEIIARALGTLDSIR